MVAQKCPYTLFVSYSFLLHIQFAVIIAINCFFGLSEVRLLITDHIKFVHVYVCVMKKLSTESKKDSQLNVSNQIKRYKLDRLVNVYTSKPTIWLQLKIDLQQLWKVDKTFINQSFDLCYNLYFHLGGVVVILSFYHQYVM